MRFCSLGSGSTGNATLIEARTGDRTTRVLIDCGFTLRALARRLAWHGVAPQELDGVFITHEHGDHVGCALHLSRRHGVPIYTSAGTWAAMDLDPRRVPAAAAALVCDGDRVVIGGLELRPFAVPHDAGEPLQLTCSNGAALLGILTDLGEPTPHIAAQLMHCDALLLECNHDSDLLAQGPYPAFLKRRVGGRLGHLANAQAAALLAACRHARLRHVVAAHLSRHNNRPELAAQALAGALGCGAHEIVVADAEAGSPWLDVG